MSLSEPEILDRHRQALGEASRACQRIASSRDPELIIFRGREYNDLKKALERLEGSARQIGQWRGDARWIRLGAVYGRTLITAKSRYAAAKWGWFGELRSLFELGKRRLSELDAKTGVIGRPILPANPSPWLAMPSLALPPGPKIPDTVH